MGEQNIQNQSAPQQQFTEETTSFDLLKWVFLVLKHWWLFVICALLAFSYAYYQNRKWQAVYYTQSYLMMQDGKSNMQSQQAFMRGFSLQQSINNQKIILRSYDFVGKVVDSLPQLTVDYLDKGRFKTNNLYGHSPVLIKPSFIADNAYGKLFKLQLNGDGSYLITSPEKEGEMAALSLTGKFGETLHDKMFFLTLTGDVESKREIYFRFMSRSSLISEIAARLQIELAGLSNSIVTVALSSPTPERDVDIINKVCEVFSITTLEEKNEVATKTIEFIDKQIGSVQQNLDKSENDIIEFRQSNQIMSVEGHSDGIMGKAQAANDRLQALKLRETYFNYLENYLKKNIAADSIMAPASLGINEPLLSSAISQINTLMVRRKALLPANPYYVRYTEDIEQAKMMIQEALKMIRASMKIEQTDLNNKIQVAQIDLTALPQRESKMRALDRQYKMDDSYYTYFLQKRAEAAIQKASNTSDNTVLETARTTGVINNNDSSKTTTMWLFIGLLVAMSFVVAKELMNNTVRTSDELDKLAFFPNIGSIRHSKTTDPILVTKSPRSSFTEMFRIIRTRIEFIVLRKTNIVILITSTESGDGKTYFATNLSAVYAMTKRKTLLIDMDIRKPSVLREFGKTTRYGATDYLVGDCTLEEAIIQIEGLEYDILSAGTIPPNPGELVRSDRLKEMIDILRTKYDYIVMDTSPVGLVADSYALMSFTDINLFVVRQNKTSKAFAKRILTQLKADNIKNLYSVLNDANPHGSGGGYYSSRYGKYGEYGEYGSYGYYFSKSKKREKEQRKKYYVDEDEGVPTTKTNK
ncbi:MAG: polysaccharide biosynthesis tyrosine autokinase [Prevotellaceae bacterium]|jgi:capsular exopolysaccharide synthesis family protein|nr:polysaccharide biosynthesis tyrosine autokinase [Prevotellaceae bacterium]